jgi:hypothetical protein
MQISDAQMTGVILRELTDFGQIGGQGQNGGVRLSRWDHANGGRDGRQ